MFILLPKPVQNHVYSSELAAKISFFLFSPNKIGKKISGGWKKSCHACVFRNGKRDSVTSVTRFFYSQPVKLIPVEAVGGAKLVAHDAEELLTLLKNVEIYE